MLYEKMQKRIAVDLKSARDANEDPNAKGEASERTWHQPFDAYFPHGYRVIKGIVIDCNGDESDAIDVIIHDRQFTPAIYQRRRRVRYSIEFNAVQKIAAAASRYARRYCLSQLQASSIPRSRRSPRTTLSAVAAATS